MANVKTLSGAIVNAGGSPLVAVPVTLLGDDSGATLGATTTNADGEWTFASLDETIRYRTEAAIGGPAEQVAVRKPASVEFDHLYVNTSLRTAAAATVALGGAITVAGALNVTGAATLGAGSRVVTSLVVGGTPSALIGELTVKGNAPGYHADLSLIEGDTDNGYLMSAVAATGAFQLQRFVSPSTYSPRLTISSAGAVAIPGALDVTGVVNVGSDLAISASASVAGSISQYTGDINGPRFHFQKGRGSVGSKAIVASGDIMGDIYFQAWDGGAIRSGALIRASVDGTPGSTDLPGALTFFTAPDGAAGSLTSRLTIGQDGLVTVANNLRVNGNIGFYNTAAQAKQTITGSRAGNAALADLLTKLATLGLITNSSSA